MIWLNAMSLTRMSYSAHLSAVKTCIICCVRNIRSICRITPLRKLRNISGSLVIAVKKMSRRDSTPLAHRFIGGKGDHATHGVPEGRSPLEKAGGGCPSGTETLGRRAPGINSWASSALSLRDEQALSLSISRELPKNHISSGFWRKQSWKHNNSNTLCSHCWAMWR